LQDGYLFLLGVIEASSLGPLPFHIHLRWAHDLVPSSVQTSTSPLKQLLERITNHPQENISKNMREHSFSNILSKLSSNYHHVRLRSYLSPGLGA
jgi:hypothetical protein